MILLIIFSGIGIALFIALVFATRRPFTLVNKIIIFLMIFLVLPMLFKYNNHLFSSEIKDIFEFFRFSPLVFGPFLYLYTLIMTDEMAGFNIKYLLHFLPFLAIVIFHFTIGLEKGGQHGDSRSWIFVAGILFSLVFYTIIILLNLRRHYRKVSDYYSYDSIMINLGWLKWITLFFFISYGFVIGASFLSPVYVFHPFFDPFHTPDIATTFFIITFSLFALKQSIVFKTEKSINKKQYNDESIQQNNERKYEKSGLKQDDEKIFYEKLENYMQSNKPYLDSDLTIADLAEKLDIPKHYVTEIINKRFENNFFMYINSYRIEEAKKKLSDEMYSGHSIIRIAYDCGFNSKSTFNAVFKKFTDVTPSCYRQDSRVKQSLQ